MYVIASQSLHSKIKNMEGVEDLESRPDKEVTFLVDRDKEIQELRERKMPTTLPGFGGGELSGRNNAEGGKEGNDVLEEG